MNTVQIQVPRIFSKVIPLPSGDVGIEHAPLQTRLPQAVLAEFFADATKSSRKNFLIVTQRSRLLEEQLNSWIDMAQIKSRRVSGGTRFLDSGSTLLIMRNEDLNTADLPFTYIDRMLVTEAQSMAENIFVGARALTRDQAIALGEISSSDHWFYNFCRKPDVNHFKISANEILEAFPNEQPRFDNLQKAFSPDQRRRYLDLEDIEILDLRATRYLEWAGQIMAVYTYHKFSKMHEDLDATMFADMSKNRGLKYILIGPRDSAKSTHGAEGFPLYTICEGLEHYILITSDTTEQACKHLAVIKEELETNQEIAQRYPAAFGAGPVWKGNAIETRNGIRVEALGAGKKIRGRRFGKHRPTLIIVDDAEGDEAAYSSATREHRRDWFAKGVMKAGGPKTNYLLIGSMIHNDGLVATTARLPVWKEKTKIYRSIISWPNRMDLWAQWENILCDVMLDDPSAESLKFYEAHKAEMHEGAEVLWEDREDLYALMLMRTTDGHASFEAEKQNNPIDPSKCEWGPNLFNDRWYDDLPETGIIASASALDPSKGKSDKHGDYQGMVTVHFHEKKILYVEADINRRPMTEMTERYVAFLNETNSQVGVCEAEQFQELLLPEIEGSSIAASVTVPIEEMMTKGVNKNMRIRRLGPWINRRRVFWRQGQSGAAMLVKQLQEFPNGDHDDGPDAFEMALRRVLQVVYGENEEAIANPF